MKLPRYQIAAAILLAALAGSLGAVGAQRWLGPTEPKTLHDFVHDRIDLEPDQARRLDQLEQRHAAENMRLELAVRRANADLAAAMNNEHEYGPEVGAAIDQVHASMGELQKASVRHVFAMREILNGRQQQQFDEQIARSLTGSSPD